jgi:hypothetical protein
VPPSLVRPPLRIQCPGGDQYRLTTGNADGVCKVYFDRGQIVGGYCTDGSNSASQTCSTGCQQTTGTGACERLDPNAPADVPPGVR